MYRLPSRLLLSLALLGLAACGGGATVPSGAPGPGTGELRARQSSCYHTTGSQYAARATVTFYGWPDNSPPGNRIAHPVIHQVASGNGTYCNPTTFATEPTDAENDEIPYGTRIYVPYVKKYFIREDDCTTSGPQGLGCSGLWFDLWIGGDAKSRGSAVIRCENSITRSVKVTVIINPPDNELVTWRGPIYHDDPPPNGTCNAPAP